jgi:uridine phosphorylase
MTYPNYQNKYKEDSLVKATNFWAYKRELGHIPDIMPPKGVIMCYSPTLFNYIKEEHNVKYVPYVSGDCFYILEENGSQIGICGGFGIGAPITAILLEELSVFGIQNYLSIGVAGCLQKNIQLGTIIVCDKAIRDEGVSHHYLKGKKYAYPSKILVKKMLNTLEANNLVYKVGSTWTIDAPYRETIVEVRKYRDEGVITVEMEAAAIFSVAEYLNLNACAIFTISDYLTEERWELHFHLTKKHLENLFVLAKDFLLSL